MNWSLLWTDYTARNVALGCAMLGCVSGVLGCLSLLRRQALVGDALSHAALPGVCLAFMVTGGGKGPILLMAGAAMACSFAMAWITVALRKTRTDANTALSLASSVFFGLGIVLLTVIQKSPQADKAGLDKFLFGQAAALVEENVATMALLGAVALAVVSLLFKEIKLLVFDPIASEVQGWPVLWLNALVQALLILAIVLGLNAVGVILMSALLVAPAAGARQWTHNLFTMMVLASSAGVVCGIAAAGFSMFESSVPTGPVLVLLLALWVVLSFLFGKERGLAWRLRNQRGRNSWRAS